MEVRFLGHACFTLSDNTFPPIETDSRALTSEVESATGSTVVVLGPGDTHST